MPSASASSHGDEYSIVVQSTTTPSRELPLTPERTKSDRHGSPPSIVRVVRTPLPAGTTDPEKEKPKTTDAEVDTVNPASAAAPPDAPVTVAPETLNWNPAISSSLSYRISTEVS